MARLDRRRVERVERHYDSLASREDYSKFIARRITMGYTNELGNITAPRFRRAKRVEDRNLPSEAAQLWGEDYSGEQVHEEAVRRLAAKLETTYLRPGFNTGHDLVPHVPEWWFDPDQTEELVGFLSAELDEFQERVEQHKGT